MLNQIHLSINCNLKGTKIAVNCYVQETEIEKKLC